MRKGGGGGHWKANKNEQGEGVLACVYVRFFRKNAEIFEVKFIVILQFFLLILMTVWNTKKSIMKDDNI